MEVVVVVDVHTVTLWVIRQILTLMIGVSGYTLSCMSNGKNRKGTHHHQRRADRSIG
jgi:hypothetical protein